MTVDLTTHYLGLNLKNPLVVAACPLTSELDVLSQLEQQGASAAILPSLFEEQIEKPHPSGRPWNEFQGINSQYFRELMHYNHGPEAYLHYLERAKRSVSLPIIASLNGTSPGGWLSYAKRIEEAGADALELNLILLSCDQQIAAADLEQRYIDVVSTVRAAVRLPLAVKIGPYFTALPHFAGQLVAAGANGLVLFNRYLHPELHVTARKLVAHLQLSSSQELNLPLRWIGILYGRIQTSLAATSGIHTGEDVVKAIAAGADVVQFASVLYEKGIQALGALLTETEAWMSANEYSSIASLKGTLSQLHCPDPAAFARANYTKAIHRFVEATA